MTKTYEGMRKLEEAYNRFHFEDMEKYFSKFGDKVSREVSKLIISDLTYSDLSDDVRLVLEKHGLPSSEDDLHKKRTKQ